MKRTPAPATARPTGVKSNMPKAPASLLARKPDTIRLGGVPISVVMPPRMVPNASGISTRPGGSSRRVASWIATGINSAIAPTLFMKPDNTAPSPTSAARLQLAPAFFGIVWRTSTSTAPDSCKPRLSTSTQATEITAGWPKPAKASAGTISPASTQASSAPAATMSWRQRLHRNIATVAPRMERIRIWSWVMGGHRRYG